MDEAFFELEGGVMSTIDSGLVERAMAYGERGRERFQIGFHVVCEAGHGDRGVLPRHGPLPSKLKHWGTPLTRW